MKNTLVEIQIKEIQDYFRNKIIDGEYEVITADSYTLQVAVDGEYKFCLWTSNGEDMFRLYEGMYNFIELEFSKEQKGLAFTKCEAARKQAWDEKVRPQKLKELEKLQKELGISQYGEVK
tara:strand:+ start:174 stop:533 length:360 start_codon:yes stop_codon:yes gene_type:complete